jgi:hypothetical protein
MVSQKSIAAQLKKIGFNQHAWGRAEVRELPNIILPDEEIFECVNGTYEGGFALLVATDVRVLLIDKKPFNYLTVEDLRFDMINEIDYNHRALGAYVDISTGNRDLKFRSYNQPRLRKLINHVQHRMAESKKKQASHQEGQNQHLEQINERLQTYLMAQYQHQQELQRSLQEAQQHGVKVHSPEPPKPSPELSDYLLAQGLLAEYKAKTGKTPDALPSPAKPVAPTQPAAAVVHESAQDDLYAEGVREVFGSHPTTIPDPDPPGKDTQGQGHAHPHAFSFDINPLRIAYSKLPMALRNRKFGRPSLHAHSLAVQQPEPVVQPQLT